jgi:hypothetical protein
MVLEVLYNSRVLGIVKRSSIPSVSWVGICSVLDQVLDDINVTSCSSEMQAGTLIVVSRVKIESLDVESLDRLKVT